MSENTSKQILLPGYNTILGHILYNFKDLLDINNSIDGEKVTSQKINDEFFLLINSNSNSGVLTTQELTKISSNVEGAPTEKYFIKLGTLFRIFQDLIYLSDKKKPLSTFDFDYDNNFCFNPANKLISLDTNVCVVPSETFQSQNNLIDKILNDFTDTNGERKDLGNTMHILLNIDMLLNTLNDTTNNEISIYNFMSSVLTNVNNSFANITDLSFIYDVDTNTYHIIDENIPGNTLPPSKINVGILNSQQGMENGSFVKNISLNSQLSPNLASQIAIGAQATTGTSKIPQESLAFSSWNKGATDRIVGTKISPKINTPNEDEKMTEEDFQSLNDFLNDQQYWSPQSTDYVSSFLPIYKKYISTEFKDQIFSSFIPINLAIEMEGLSGIRIYQKYSITEQYLPKIYKDKIEFLIKGISHTINTKEWNTTIDGFSIPKISKDLITSDQKSPTQQTSNNKVQQSEFLGYIENTAWSAVFITTIINTRAQINFPKTAAHTKYAQEIRTSNEYPWEALDPATTIIEVGDVIVKNRSNNQLTFNSPTWSGPSHGDIVTKLNSNSISQIGGNLGDTAKEVTSIIKPSGELKKVSTTSNPKSAYFVVLRYKGPNPPATQNLIAQEAIKELKKWDNGNIKETDDRQFALLDEYYRTGKLYNNPQV
tara:strand:- start:250 stop:2217 length:1968 start_codon:yes stop_codon:yes gene_type:complete